MALIRILAQEGLTSLSYVKNGADSQKITLIDATHDILAILAIFDHFGQIFKLDGLDGLPCLSYVKNDVDSKTHFY